MLNKNVKYFLVTLLLSINAYCEVHISTPAEKSDNSLGIHFTQPSVPEKEDSKDLDNPNHFLKTSVFV